MLSHLCWPFLFVFVAVHPDSFFLIATSEPFFVGYITRMDPETRSSYTVPMSSRLYRPIAVDYDPVERKIYWTEVGLFNQIRSASLDGSGVLTVTDAGAGLCSRFPICETTTPIYFRLLLLLLVLFFFLTVCWQFRIALAYPLYVVAVKTADTHLTCWELLPDAELDGLAIDPLSRLIFYTDAGNDLIAMMTMSSLATKTVINSSLDRPGTIALDTANG